MADKREVIVWLTIVALWMAALVMIVLGSVQRHFVIHMSGSIIAILLTVATAVNSITVGGRWFGKLKFRSDVDANGRGGERGDLKTSATMVHLDRRFNIIKEENDVNGRGGEQGDLIASAPMYQLEEKLTVEQRNERKRERIREEIQRMKRDVQWESGMKDFGKNTTMHAKSEL